MRLDNFRFEKKIIESWNNTIKSKAMSHPKNTLELRKLIKFLKKITKNI